MKDGSNTGLKKENLAHEGGETNVLGEAVSLALLTGMAVTEDVKGLFGVNFALGLVAGEVSGPSVVKLALVEVRREVKGPSGV